MKIRTGKGATPAEGLAGVVEKVGETEPAVVKAGVEAEKAAGVFKAGFVKRKEKTAYSYRSFH